jgi:hypothetical protein
MEKQAVSRDDNLHEWRLLPRPAARDSLAQGERRDPGCLSRGAFWSQNTLTVP